ncbi:hypothetical protein AB0M95_36955 [Sphaerisporangium sp. NPDC051017]|uniref:hypothetical protein n=1 Tax=Sphaerisporangium sp. NPDC051017 TaxID=3154636 RepID=UPI00341BFFB8
MSWPVVVVDLLMELPPSPAPSPNVSGGAVTGTTWKDWVDVVAAAAGLLAVAFAIVTVRQTAAQGAENMRALQRERRIDFELDVLSQLAEYNQKDTNTSGATARIETLARMLPKELIPLTRAAVRLPTTPEGEAQVAEAKPAAAERHQQVRDHLRNEIADEVHKAIEIKLNERH